MIGRYLVETGALTEADLARALAKQAELQARGERKRLGDVLLEMGLISEARLEQALMQLLHDSTTAARSSSGRTT